ncbi:MAG: Mut7-C RNAse domain-containing protein [Candidatus Krumholzibacteriia bacterium]
MVTFRLSLRGDLADLCGGRGDLVRRLPAPTSLKDAVEALGIPHVELGRAAVDGVAADLAQLIRDGACVEVWPAVPRPLADPRFLCDLHLGKLARLLRFAGFDTVWDRTLGEPQLAALAARDGRAVLSRHRALLKRSQVACGLLVRSGRADEQLAEVLRRFELVDKLASPARCTACNGRLAATAKADVPVAIPPRTAAWLDHYWLCGDCGHLFWEGTHAERLRRRLAAAAAVARAQPDLGNHPQSI